MGLKRVPFVTKREFAVQCYDGYYILSENYIFDDIIVFRNSNVEFLANVTLVFKRLTKYKLTVNPLSYFIGTAEVEVCCYEIDERGMSFSRKKNRHRIIYT